MTLNEIIELASQHAERLTDDVRQASTRIEHIRVTARANEAVNLLHHLTKLTEESNSDDNQEGTSGTVRLDG
jgi:hypothetical protein